MHTITIQIEKDEVYQNLMRVLEKFSGNDIELTEFDSDLINEDVLEENISQGLTDIAKGRVKSLDNVLAEARAKYGL